MLLTEQDEAEKLRLDSDPFTAVEEGGNTVGAQTRRKTTGSIKKANAKVIMQGSKHGDVVTQNMDTDAPDLSRFRGCAHTSE